MTKLSGTVTRETEGEQTPGEVALELTAHEGGEAGAGTSSGRARNVARCSRSTRCRTPCSGCRRRRKRPGSSPRESIPSGGSVVQSVVARCGAIGRAAPCHTATRCARPVTSAGQGLQILRLAATVSIGVSYGATAQGDGRPQSRRQTGARPVRTMLDAVCLTPFFSTSDEGR